MSTVKALDRLRQPEYTGENRCGPCTAVNLVLAVALAAAVGAVWLPAGTAALAVSLAAIYLRGYLVPGTPTLTRRYLPEPVLALFGKAEPDHPEPPADVDVETVLDEAGVLRECPDRDDLCLTDPFRSAWRERIAARRGADDREILRDLLGGPAFGDVDADRYEIEPVGDAYVASVGEVRIAQWESRAAYVADAAAADLLAERYAPWRGLDFERRATVLGALRLWLDRCPECDGPVALGGETVESCCRAREVVAASCGDCGRRLLETGVGPEAMATTGDGAGASA
jgi:hypothetical protein